MRLTWVANYRPILAGLCAVALAGGLLTQATSAADTERRFVLVGRVTKVTDGDTIRVDLDSGNLAVRFHGIDAPETNPRQPGGVEAREALERLVGGVGATVELDVVTQRDRYDRAVALVYHDGVLTNAEMIKQGHAFAYREYIGQVDEDRVFCRLEAAARSSRKGLWGRPSSEIMAPWEWRRLKRGTISTTRGDWLAETARDCEAAIGRDAR